MNRFSSPCNESTTVSPSSSVQNRIRSSSCLPKKPQLSRGIRLSFLFCGLFCILFMTCLFIPFVKIQTDHDQSILSFAQLCASGKEYAPDQVLVPLIAVNTLGLVFCVLPLLIRFRKPGWFLIMPLLSGLCSWMQILEARIIFIKEKVMSGSANLIMEVLTLGRYDPKKLVFTEEAGARLLPALALALIILCITCFLLCRKREKQLQLSEELPQLPENDQTVSSCDASRPF